MNKEPILEALDYTGKWFAVRVLNGKEQKVGEAINKAFPWVNFLVPMQAVVKMRSGKPVTLNQRIYPGYVMLNFELTHSTIEKIESVDGVFGFVGGKVNGFPVEIPKSQVEAMVADTKEMQDEFSESIHFEVGDKVRIIAGPFVNFDAKVDEVNGNKIKVLISVFGQVTSLYLDRLELQKTT